MEKYLYLVTQLNQIHKGGDLLLSLINEVLDLATIESGKMKFEFRNLPVGDLIVDSVAFSSTLAASMNIDLRNRVDNPTPLVRIDILRAKQVLLNVISNAIKYNRDSGHVTVDGGQHGEDFYRIRVHDSGHGIPQDKQSETIATLAKQHRREKPTAQQNRGHPNWGDDDFDYLFDVVLIQQNSS